MKDKRRILIYILAAVIIFVILVTSVGCNYQIVDFNYKFTKVHMSFDGEHYQCYDIDSWRDYEDGEQIQVDIDGPNKGKNQEGNDIFDVSAKFIDNYYEVARNN